MLSEKTYQSLFRDLAIASSILSAALLGTGGMSAYSAELDPESGAYRICGGGLGGGGNSETAECYKRELEESSTRKRG